MHKWLHRMHERLKGAPKPVKITVGIILVIMGLIGGLLPIIPGFLFGIPGLMILAEYFPPAHRLLEWLKRKYHEAIRREMRQ